MLLKANFILAILFLSSLVVRAQSMFDGYEQLLSTPRNYLIHYTDTQPIIDGNVMDKSWEKAEWSEKFTDIQGPGKALPRFDTRVKMLWNDSCLFIAAKIDEPNVWANVTHHDDVIFNDNDFEVFINPDNTAIQYFEIEVNARNKLFDLFLAKPYRSGTGALFSWDAPGIRTGVQIQGSINNSTDQDKGWTVEMAIPFKAISLGNSVHFPEEGSLWRINFSRVEWDTDKVNGEYVKRKIKDGSLAPENNWVWSPQGVINMHYPERWGYLRFTKKTNETSQVFELPFVEKQMKYLWLVYYMQMKYKNEYGKYANSLHELGITEQMIQIDKWENQLTMEATEHQFMVMIRNNNQALSLTEDGLIGNPDK